MKKQEILRFYQTYKLYIFPVVVVLSSLILVVFVIYPQMTKLISNQKVEGDILSKVTVLEAKAQTLESYDSTELGLKVNYALNAFPADKDFATAIGLLQDLTAQSGLDITSMSLGSGNFKTANLQSYIIKLDLSGPVAVLPALLRSIEYSPRIMRVNGIEVNAARDPNSATVSLTVDILFAPTPSNFGSVDSPLSELSAKDQEIIQKLASFGGSSITQSPATIQSGSRGKENPFE